MKIYLLDVSPQVLVVFCEERGYLRARNLCVVVVGSDSEVALEILAVGAVRFVGHTRVPFAAQVRVRRGEAPHQQVHLEYIKVCLRLLKKSKA